MGRRLIWGGDSYGEETYMEKRLTWTGDLYREETYMERGLTQRHTQRREIRGEKTYMENTW